MEAVKSTGCLVTYGSCKINCVHRVCNTAPGKSLSDHSIFLPVACKTVAVGSSKTVAVGSSKTVAVGSSKTVAVGSSKTASNVTIRFFCPHPPLHLVLFSALAKD